MSRLTSARDTLWMSYSFGAAFGLQAVYFVLVARTLGPAEFGKFGAALAIATLVGPFATLGAGNVLVREVSRKPSAFSAQLGTALAAIAVSGTIVVMLAVSLVGILASSLLVPAAILLVSESYCARLVELSMQAFQSRERLHSAAHINVFAATLRLASCAVFVSGGSHSAVGWSVGYAISSVLSGLGSILYTRLSLGSPEFRGINLLSAWRAGLPFSLGQASKTLYTDIDKVMLERLAFPGVAGLYTAASRLLTISFTPIQALVYSKNVFLFRNGAGGAQSAINYLKRAIPLILVLSLVCGGMLAAASFIAPYLLGSAYSQTSVIALYLCGMPLIQGLQYILGDTLMGLDRQGFRSACQILAAASNIGLNVVLIPAWSWRGAVVSTYVAQALLCMGLFASLIWERRRTQPVPFRDAIEADRADGVFVPGVGASESA